MILLIPCVSGKADWAWQFFNSDGSTGEMCGNGARCFARFVQKLTGTNRDFTFETEAGVIKAKFQGERVTVSLTPPTNLRLSEQLPLSNGLQTIHSLNTGVPHVVIPVVNIEEVDVPREGAAVRRHEMFAPKGANVNFLERRGGKKITIRTYERGVEGETLACGTGVVASALIFAATEKTDGPIGVLVRGGSELSVDFRRDGERFTDVTLIGPAEFVFEGTLEL